MLNMVSIRDREILRSLAENARAMAELPEMEVCCHFYCFMISKIVDLCYYYVSIKESLKITSNRLLA